MAETEACVRQLRAIRAPSGSKPGVAWRVFARPGASWAIVGQSSRSLGPVCGLSRDLLGTVLTPCELSLGPVVLPWGHFEPKGAPRMRAFQARKAVKKNRVFLFFFAFGSTYESAYKAEIWSAEKSATFSRVSDSFWRSLFFRTSSCSKTGDLHVTWNVSPQQTNMFCHSELAKLAVDTVKTLT